MNIEEEIKQLEAKLAIQETKRNEAKDEIASLKKKINAYKKILKKVSEIK